MEIDPHTLQQIIERIYQQMRCPQCSSRVPVDFSSVRVVASDAMLLQLKCDSCGAFIVLHASLQGAKFDHEHAVHGTQNFSTQLNLAEGEVHMLHHALQECGGSFEKLFQTYGAKDVAES
ncbi:hypothetical protein COU80_00785 [Candidatus Peregrinibacteria bacterium CG10_big_fil_rev_8_21_14_0_10_55_24]|nr:MAG: hypothetical protein COU80_00785 [Candidatus Peregrinibacteria bacterium CG10_big_fil_rev_8_21_14_0_10_55_24]